jgi:hypothetical protein
MVVSCPNCGSKLVDHPEDKYRVHSWMKCLGCGLARKLWSCGPKEKSVVMPGDDMPDVKVRGKKVS